MVFIYLYIFYFLFFFVSNFFNTTLFFINIVEIYYSNFLVLVWILSIILILYFNNNNDSWVTDILLYIFGMYRLIILNFLDSLSLLFKNFNLFNFFIYYNLKNTTDFLKSQIWTPLYKRGGYLFLLNSSRTRWQLSKTNSIFKNK